MLPQLGKWKLTADTIKCPGGMNLLPSLHRSSSQGYKMNVEVILRESSKNFSKTILLHTLYLQALLV